MFRSVYQRFSGGNAVRAAPQGREKVGLDSWNWPVIWGVWCHKKGGWPYNCQLAFAKDVCPCVRIKLFGRYYSPPMGAF